MFIGRGFDFNDDGNNDVFVGGKVNIDLGLRRAVGVWILIIFVIGVILCVALLAVAGVMAVYDYYYNYDPSSFRHEQFEQLAPLVAGFVSLFIGAIAFRIMMDRVVERRKRKPRPIDSRVVSRTQGGLPTSSYNQIPQLTSPISQPPVFLQRPVATPSSVARTFRPIIGTLLWPFELCGTVIACAIHGDAAIARDTTKRQGTPAANASAAVDKSGGDRYWLRRGNVTKGPVTKPQMHELLKTGNILESDMVSSSPDGPWKRISS